ncbi:hypothetical protein CALVIDRAFT_562086 [Calocera viscosa TUFC12733]|uniref:F-box domain-containing protein n=1 Tax=Calocera viscosa (strain TUFC12733) TaxID=1330018 RepID=A0A167PCB9_CALVF|nr:hypothetical protein CALVIDRAFT_562086 [Calocera viscosa TUFC12733]
MLGTPAELDIVATLLTSKPKYLRVDILPYGGDWRAGSPNLFSHIRKVAPRLLKFDLQGGTTGHRATSLSRRHFEPAFTAMSALSHVSLPGGLLSSSTLLELSTLTALRHLSVVDTSKLYELCGTDSWPTFDPHAFLHLESLTLDGDVTSTTACIAALGMFPSRLEVNGSLADETISLQGLTKRIAAVGGKLVSIAIRMLSTNDKADVDFAVRWEDITALYTCSELRTFELSVQIHAMIAVSDMDLLQMSQGWPALESFRFLWRQSPWGFIPSGLRHTDSLTIQGILACSVRMPKLHAVDISVVNFTFPDELAVLDAPLESLTVRWPTVHSAIQLASILALACPSLSIHGLPETVLKWLPSVRRKFSSIAQWPPSGISQ